MKIVSLLSIFFLLVIAGTSKADVLRQKIEQGNSLYNQEQFLPAQLMYQQVPEEEANSPFLMYNIGNSLYQQQNYSEAIDQYRQVYSSDHPELNRAVQFNIGCAQYRMAEQELEQQNVEGAIEHLKSTIETYKYAIRNFPDDQDLKYNYSQAYRKLKELEQQQEEQQEDQQQEQDQQDQQEQEQNQDQEQDQNQQGDQDQQSENQDQQDQQQDESESSENQDQSGEQQDQSEDQQGEQQNSDEQDQQAEQPEEQQISEEEMKEAQKEMARQILQGLFDEDQMQLMDRLYKPAKKPGKFNKDW